MHHLCTQIHHNKCYIYIMGNVTGHARLTQQRSAYPQPFRWRQWGDASFCYIKGVMRMNQPYVTVDYDENKPETYRGIVIEMPSGEIHRINTNNFNRDYQRALDEYTPFNQSSMVDNYRFDLNQEQK